MLPGLATVLCPTAAALSLYPRPKIQQVSVVKGFERRDRSLPRLLSVPPVEELLPANLHSAAATKSLPRGLPTTTIHGDRAGRRRRSVCITLSSKTAAGTGRGHHVHSGVEDDQIEHDRSGGGPPLPRRAGDAASPSSWIEGIGSDGCSCSGCLRGRHAMVVPGAVMFDFK